MCITAYIHRMSFARVRILLDKFCFSSHYRCGLKSFTNTTISRTIIVIVAKVILRIYEIMHITIMFQLDDVNATFKARFDQNV